MRPLLPLKLCFFLALSRRRKALCMVGLPNQLRSRHRNFRDSESKFRQMGALKPKMVLRLFEQLGFQTIVLADTDTVWLRDPASTLRILYKYLQLLAHSLGMLTSVPNCA